MKKLLTSLVCIFIAAVACATDLRFDKALYKIYIYPDGSYQQDDQLRVSLLTPVGVGMMEKDSLVYSPKKDKITKINATVTQPHGKVIVVDKQHIFTRPAASNPFETSITNRMSTTIVFPKLVPGSQIYSHWVVHRKPRTNFGFSLTYMPVFNSPMKEMTVIINAPKNFPLKWHATGLYKVREQQQGKRRIITAVIHNKPALKTEPNMVSVSDVNSLFVVSAIPSWLSMGEKYWQQAKAKTKANADIHALAKHLVKDKKGLDIVKALYNWVTFNIRYVSIYLSAAEDYIPHSVSKILQNGYGDCKDKVALLQSLLSVYHIKSQPILIYSGDSYRVSPLPVPQQFNHLILYVPKYKLYLDPTSRFANFGVLDPMLSGKFALVSASPARIVKTPELQPAINRYELRQTVRLNLAGEFKGEGEIKGFGQTNAMLRSQMMYNSDPSELAKKLLDASPEGGFGTMKSEHPFDVNSNVVIKTKWHSPHAVMMHDKTYFTIPVGIDDAHISWLRDVLMETKRHYPIMLKASTHSWQYRIQIPKSYEIEMLPKAIHFKNAIGSYHAVYTKENHAIKVTRELIIHRSVFAASEYAAVKDLIYRSLVDVRSVVGIEKE